jgi:cytochrome c553
MDARDLEELGLSRDQMQQIVDTPAAVAARLAQMAARHGLSEAELEAYRQDYAHLLAACAQCHDTGTCAQFLADPVATPDQATFCPNHADYTALATHPG